MTTVIARSADEWETAVSGSFVPLRVKQISPGFDGSIAHRSFDSGVSVSRVRSGDSRLERTETAARADAVPSVLFVSHLSGLARVSQNGRQSDQRAGQSVLYVTHRPYELSFPSAIDEVVFRIPIARLGLRESRVEQLSARTFEPSDSFRLVHTFLTELCACEPSAVDSQLARVGGELLSMALMSLDGEVAPRSPEATLAAMTQFIRWNATDRSLDPDAVARAFHVSRRQLYKIFQAAGRRPADVIRRTRIDRACDLLRADPGLRVMEIAFRCGFDDATTFARAFASIVGISASAWRSGERAA